MGSGAGERVGVIAHGNRAAFWEEESVLELDRDSGCRTLEVKNQGIARFEQVTSMV